MATTPRLYLWLFSAIWTVLFALALLWFALSDIVLGAVFLVVTLGLAPFARLFGRDLRR